MIDECELLRTPDNICQYDVRNAPGRDFHGRKTRLSGLERHHKSIDQFRLMNGVPEKIVINFETAKNIYLYAWYVYRFYNVAEHQVLTCLELALCNRLKNEIPKSCYPRTDNPMLHALLKYAIENEIIKNEGFTAWHQAAETRARSRYTKEQLKKISEEGLESMEVDYSQISIQDEDKDFEYVHELKSDLVKVRNEYAHGSTMLDNLSLGTFKIVSEIINQVYSE